MFGLTAAPEISDGVVSDELAEDVVTMGDTYDVVIAGYTTIGAAKTDFEAVVKLVEAKRVRATEGVILGERGPDGAVQLTDTADHHGRKGVGLGGGVGVVAGLFAPPLLASAVVGSAVGGLIGRFTKHRVDSGIETIVSQTVPKGSAGIATLVDSADTPTVTAALARSAKTSVVSVDGHGIKALKEGLAEASKGAPPGS